MVPAPCLPVPWQRIRGTKPVTSSSGFGLGRATGRNHLAPLQGASSRFSCRNVIDYAMHGPYQAASWLPDATVLVDTASIFG